MITTIKKLQGILTRFIYLFLSKSSKPYVKVFPSYKILIFALVGFTLSDFFSWNWLSSDNEFLY